MVEGPGESLVECYSGSEYAERPRSFTWGGRRWHVAAVLKRARHPGEKVFWVRSSEGDRFELIYDELADHWRVVRDDGS